MIEAKFGGQREIPTKAESDFCGALEALTSPPFFDFWLHSLPSDRSPWMLVSLTFCNEKGGVLKTLRLDFDGVRIKGGWSPGNLNWDCEIPATEAGVNLGEPDGIDKAGESPELLAQLASSWFLNHYESSK